jgi:RecB family exonuclease
MPDYRNLPPVEDNVEPPEFWSQTFLGHVDNCPRAGYLYQKYRGGPTGHPLDRGTAAHEVFARLAKLLVDNDEPTLPPDLAKAVANEVILERSDLIYPWADKDDVRIMAFHWAEGAYFPPKNIAGIEQSLELELAGGVKVRGKVDLVLVYPETAHAQIVDYKTAFAVPSQRAFARSFQTRMYALLLAEGKVTGTPTGIGAGIKTFDLMEIYPRYLRSDGLLTRAVTLERSDLTDFKLDVEAVIARARRGFEEGLWPAVTSSHCARCPARRECPIPEELFPLSDLMPDDPPAAAARRYHLSEQAKFQQKALREYAAVHGPIYYGPTEPGKPGRVYGPVVRESERVKDKEALKHAIEEALAGRAEFNMEDHFRVQVDTRFEDRKYEPDDFNEEDY